MIGIRAILARFAYRLVARAPSAAVARARTAGRVAPLLEAGFAAVGAPLYGSIVPVARGPGAGLSLLAERRSLVWISGCVEEQVQAAITRFLPVGGTFVDVGASVGFFTLLAARVAGPAGTVIAFEPQAKAAESARQNVELNGFKNVTVIEGALSSRVGHASLAGAGRATARLVEEKQSNRRALRVACTSLDVFLGDRGDVAPDLVKIDVEGHEVAVLDGMRMTLATHHPVLLIEPHGDVGGLLAILHDAGYAASVLGPNGPAGDVSRSAHLVALPNRH